jgi:hypothetical protein
LYRFYSKIFTYVHGCAFTYRSLVETSYIVAPPYTITLFTLRWSRLLE